MAKNKSAWTYEYVLSLKFRKASTDDILVQLSEFQKAFKEQYESYIFEKDEGKKAMKKKLLEVSKLPVCIEFLKSEIMRRKNGL